MSIQHTSKEFIPGDSNQFSQVDPVLVMVRKAVTNQRLFAASSADMETPIPLAEATASTILEQAVVEKDQQKVAPSHSTTRRLPLVVGVSGGADSICLVHVLAQLADVWNLELHIAHLNHNLRAEASTDAMFVARIAQQLGLPFHVATVAQGQLTDSSSSLEGAARKVRYRFLTVIAKTITPTGQRPLVAVAHHADDQAETILMNLIRGGGMQGLSGMDWCTDWPDVRIVRPLLAIKRREIVDFNHRYNLTWVEDTTNQDQTMRRNRIRHEIIPILTQLNPNLTETLSRTAATLSAELERAANWDKQIFERIQPPSVDQQPDLPRRIVFRLAQLMEQELATQRNVIRMALAKVAGNQLHDIGFDMVESIIEAIQEDSVPGVAHPIAQSMSWTIGRLEQEQELLLSLHLSEALPFLPTHPLLNRSWQRKYGHQSIPHTGQLACPYNWSLRATLLAKVAMPNNWKETKGRWDAYLDADAAGALILTTPTPGTRFAPLGMHGKHQSIGDLFTNRKILKSFRSRWPIVRSISSGGSNPEGAVPNAPAEGQVLWICGLQQANAAQITERTSKILHLRWIKVD